MIKFPEMTVEKRESDTSHGLRAPLDINSSEYQEQLSDAIELCQGAKAPANQEVFLDWHQDVINILDKYAVEGVKDYAHALSKFGFDSWAECVEFVMNDNCDDFASIVLKWTQLNKIPHKNNLGFIDGDGIGFKRRYIDRLGRKSGSRGTLEKAFDAKYFFEQPRPLEVLSKKIGLRAATCIANYIHPGHYAYPAGHGAKFFEVVDLVRDTWELTPEQDSMLLTAAYTLSMGRSGGFVHTAEENLASGYLAGLPEFSEYGE